MKRKSRFVVVGLLVMILVTTFFPLSAAALPNDAVIMLQENERPQMAGQGEVTPQAQVIDWRYKVIDGYLYRRLYNYTLGVWIGEWERVP